MLDPPTNPTAGLFYSSATIKFPEILSPMLCRELAIAKYHKGKKEDTPVLPPVLYFLAVYGKADH